MLRSKINAANIDKDLAHLTAQAKAFDVSIEDVSGKTASIAVQGPKSKELLTALLGGIQPTATRLTPTPVLQHDLHYSQDMTRPMMREAYQADRDAVLGSLFRLLGTPRSNGADA